MPIQQCKRNGKSGWRWGTSGTCYTGTGALAKARRQERAIRASGFTGNQRRSNPLRIDPTRTTLIRKRFEAELMRRLDKLKRAIRLLVVDEDAFGLTRGVQFNETLAVNQRWRFHTSPQKVDAFQGWLRERADLGVAGGSPDSAYWRAYIEDGYRKGAGRAFDDTKAAERAAKEWTAEEAKFYQGTREEFLRSSFGRPVAIEKVQLLAQRVYTDLKNVNESMATQMGRTLADGLVQGKNPRQIGRELNAAVDGIGKRRGQMIARTEVIRAHSEGQLDALESLGVEEVGVMVEWTATPDERTCELCSSMEGAVMKIEEARGLIPRHVMCLPGNSLVLSRSRIAAVSKRWYDGKLVIFRTAAGRELSCTPNHPVLTDCGWTPARLLDVGSNVVSDGGRQWESFADHDNDQEMPTRIEEVAASFAESGSVIAREVPLSSPDFHGDGIDGEIAVVWSDGKLGDASDSSLFEHRLQATFKRRGARGRVRLNGNGPAAQCFKGSNASFACFVGCGDLSFSSFGAHPSPLGRLSFALGSSGHSCGAQDIPYHLSGDPVSVRKRVFRNTFGIGGNNIGYGQGGSLAERPVLVAEHSDDDLVRDAELAGQLARGLAGLVFLDEVVSIRVNRFSGHVYNLQTEGGYYSAQGIITHNCRCAWVPANIGESPKGQKRGKTEVQRSIDQSISREIPKREIGKRTLAEQKNLTRWGGADKRIAKVRPKAVVEPRVPKGKPKAVVVVEPRVPKGKAVVTLPAKVAKPSIAKPPTAKPPARPVRIKPSRRLAAEDKTAALKQQLAEQRAATAGARKELEQIRAGSARAEAQLQKTTTKITARDEEVARLKAEVKAKEAEVRAIDKKLKAQDLAHDEELRRLGITGFLQ